MTRRKKQCQQPFHNFLPNELIIEIMSRLPAKSLYRFKCVSKSWSSLISDPQFIKKHVRVLETEDSLERKRIILRYPFYSIKSCSLHSIYHEPFGYSIDHDYPLKGSYCRFKIIGTCNGLVCLCIKERYKEHILFLWNPCTGESIRIMEPSTVEDHRLAVIRYGFGYNQQSDDYMVVKLNILGAYKPQIKVYSLRGNSWRDIDGFPFEVHCIESSKYVGGTVNWGVNRCSDSTWNIVSLDLAKQRFLEIPHPDYGDGAFCPLLKVLEGRLCVLCDRSDVSVDVWMMKEYGVKESWVKMFTVPYAAELRPFQYPRTLCFLEYTGILMYFTRTLVLYDYEQRAFRYPLIYGVQDCHEADTYSESIVSPRVYRGIGFGHPNNY